MSTTSDDMRTHAAGDGGLTVHSDSAGDVEVSTSGAPASSPVLIPSPTRHGDSGLSGSGDRSERRRYDAPARISWAAQRPYELRTETDLAVTPGVVDPVARALRRRARWTRPLVLRSAIGDGVVALGVMALTTFSLYDTRQIAPLLGLAAAVVWVGLVTLMRGYDPRRLGDGPEDFQVLLRAGVAVVAGLGVAAYSFQVLLPRRVVLIAVPLIVLLSLINRQLVRKHLHNIRYAGAAMRRTLIVGEPTAVREVIADLKKVKHHGYDFVGACVPVPGPEIAENLDLGVLGGVSEVPQVVVDNDIDSVIVVGAQLSGTPLRRLAWALEQTGADLVVAPGLVEVTGPYVTLRPSAGLSLLVVEPPSARMGRMMVKAAIDRTVGFFMLLFAAPIIGVAALLVKTTSRGPAFFRQPRVGLDGEHFTMLKLRSMVVDAEARLAEIEHQSDRDGLMFKMASDPRVTKVGGVLRRFSLDELPQLWNVVRGDMSLVGPRPPLPSEYDQYHDAVHRRLRVRPGLTGLWQVSGRADLTWEESVRLDLRYVDNWSIALDLQILWKTIRAVLKGSGAY